MEQLKTWTSTVDASPRHDCDLETIWVNDKNTVEEMELENNLEQSDLFKTLASFWLILNRTDR